MQAILTRILGMGGLGGSAIDVKTGSVASAAPADRRAPAGPAAAAALQVADAGIAALGHAIVGGALRVRGSATGVEDRCWTDAGDLTISGFRKVRPRRVVIAVTMDGLCPRSHRADSEGVSPGTAFLGCWLRQGGRPTTQLLVAVGSYDESLQLTCAGWYA